MTVLLCLAEAIARDRMSGTRRGSDRLSWRHAQDVAERVAAHLSHLEPEDRETWTAVAWLHDVLEDGTQKDPGDLRDVLVEGGVPAARAAHIASMVEFLTKAGDWTADSYFGRLRREGPPEVRIVKLLDRLANLTEGRDTLEAADQARKIDETREFILPLLDGIPEPLRSEIRKALIDVMA